MTLTEKSLEILRLTDDGQNLAPEHLYLLQCAANDTLNAEGIVFFDTIHAQVTGGQYDRLKVYLHGVEHITKDSEGYIYYKGQHVNHYSHKNWRHEKFDAEILAAVCQLLEHKGHPTNTYTCCWRIEEYLTPEELESVGYNKEYTGDGQKE